MKRYLFILIFILGFHAIGRSVCLEQIKSFYTAYLTNVLRDNSKNEALCRKYLTKELLDKLQRVGNATGGDPVIRAQDANMDAIETLNVEKLTGGWYMVSYLWDKKDTNSITMIPVKAQNMDGECKITYITPIWNDAQYGDELLSCKSLEAGGINQSSEPLFLESFFKTYVSIYCAMPKDMNAQLVALRADNLSKNALEQFKNAEKDNINDGLSGYDLLIHNFDFDCLWCKSVKVSRLKDGEYQITYSTENNKYKVDVTIIKQDNRYKINSLNSL